MYIKTQPVAVVDLWDIDKQKRNWKDSKGTSFIGGKVEYFQDG